MWPSKKLSVHDMAIAAMSEAMVAMMVLRRMFVRLPAPAMTR